MTSLSYALIGAVIGFGIAYGILAFLHNRLYNNFISYIWGNCIETARDYSNVFCGTGLKCRELSVFLKRIRGFNIKNASDFIREAPDIIEEWHYVNNECIRIARHNCVPPEVIAGLHEIDARFRMIANTFAYIP